MKNITFRADEKLLNKARIRAANEQKSLSQVFQEFLENYSNSFAKSVEYHVLMEKLKYVKVGKKISRDDMNER